MKEKYDIYVIPNQTLYLILRDEDKYLQKKILNNRFL
jgi:hypothetical protein